jgi:signal transduction histidine kinase
MTTTIAEDVATIARIEIVPQILDVICRTTGMGFAAIVRVTEERWVACAVHDEINRGLKAGDELVVATTICNAVRRDGRPVAIDHVAEDLVYRDHPSPPMYGFQSYVSVPIRHRGQVFGTLCAVDPRPARVNTPETLGMFTLFADLIARNLEVEERLERSEAALLSERQGAELREQFVAVLGHDLRNPLAAIHAGSQLLLKTPLDERGQSIVAHVRHSVDRMAGLIDDLMDFTRVRLGGGFCIEPRVDPALAATLHATIDELRLACPARLIVEEIAIAAPVACDPARVAQLLSNLLGNALTHGAKCGPVVVRAVTTGAAFELSVANQGDTIPPEVQARLFQPFVRAHHGPGEGGLGLGLYIASEIARVHGGTLTLASDASETCFTFRMPLAADELFPIGEP